jgi:hypothetical protein
MPEILPQNCLIDNIFLLFSLILIEGIVYNQTGFCRFRAETGRREEKIER